MRLRNVVACAVFASIAGCDRDDTEGEGAEIGAATDSGIHTDEDVETEGTDGEEVPPEETETETAEEESSTDGPDEEETDGAEEDTCATRGASEACLAGDVEGVRYCDVACDVVENEEGTLSCAATTGGLAWGECLTQAACVPGETRDCGLGEDFGDLEESCVLFDQTPQWDPSACNTPLVLDFSPDSRVRFEASGAQTFDISGGGQCLNSDWPALDTPYLAYDRDGNGFIDGGHELFGSGTVATGRRAKDGFVALADLDDNRDGWVDARDPGYAGLVLWRDYDGDRVGSLDELEPIAHAGIRALPTVPASRDKRCDRGGNCEGERAAVPMSGGLEAALIDVYPACQ